MKHWFRFSYAQYIFIQERQNKYMHVLATPCSLFKGTFKVKTYFSSIFRVHLRLRHISVNHKVFASCRCNINGQFPCIFKASYKVQSLSICESAWYLHVQSWKYLRVVAIPTLSSSVLQLRHHLIKHILNLEN